MADLRMFAIHAAIDLAIHDEAASHAGAEGEVEEPRDFLLRVMILREGRDVCIHIQAEGALEFFLHQGLQWDIAPLGLMQGADHAGRPVQRAADCRADACDGRAIGDGVDHLVQQGEAHIQRARGEGAFALDDTPMGIGGCGDQFGAADIEAYYNFWNGGHSVFSMQPAGEGAVIGGW